MVAPDLGHALGQAFLLLGALGLDDGHGQAVDEEDGIGAVGEGCTRWIHSSVTWKMLFSG